MMNEDNVRKPLGLLERTACWMLGYDPTLLEQCHLDDRIFAVRDLGALACAFMLQLVLWGCTLGSFDLPWVAVVFVALIIAVTVMLLEVSMASNDRVPRGVLRGQSRMPAIFYGLLGVRFAISLFLSVCTSFGVDLIILKEETQMVMEAHRQDKNNLVIKDYEAKEKALRKQELGLLEQELATRQRERTEVVAAAARVTDELRRANADANEAALEASRQRDGFGGRREGEGKLFRDASLRADQARTTVALMQDRLDSTLAAQRNAELALGEANTRFAEGTERLAPRLQELAKERDQRLLPAWDGPVTRVKALWELRNDPEKGAAVTWTTALVFLGVVTLEMVFILNRIAFKGASLYDHMWVARIQRDAVRVATDFNEGVQEARRRRFRVVGNPDAANDPDNT